MTRRPKTFTQAEVARVFKAAKSAGEIVRVEIDPNGKITATPIAKREPCDLENEWESAK